MSSNSFRSKIFGTGNQKVVSLFSLASSAVKNSKSNSLPSLVEGDKMFKCNFRSGYA